MNQQLDGTMDVGTKKHRFPLYAKIILWPVGLLLFSLLRIWYDAVPSSFIDHGYPGESLSKVKLRFALPLPALFRSEGFALNLLLTFLFLALVLAAALVPGRLCWRRVQVAGETDVDRKTVGAGKILTLFSAPLAFLLVFYIYKKNSVVYIYNPSTQERYEENSSIWLLLCLLVVAYLYLRALFLLRKQEPHQAVLYSCIAGMAGCVGMLLLVQSLLETSGMQYRYAVFGLLQLLLILLCTGLLVVQGQMLFARLDKAKPGIRRLGKVITVLLLVCAFLFLVFWLLFAVDFCGDICGDILSIQENGRASVTVSHNPFLRDSWEEHFNHICTFFMPEEGYLRG